MDNSDLDEEELPEEENDPHYDPSLSPTQKLDVDKLYRMDSMEQLQQQIGLQMNQRNKGPKFSLFNASFKFKEFLAPVEDNGLDPRVTRKKPLPLYPVQKYRVRINASLALQIFFLK